MFSSFPVHAAGAALVILRVCVALSLLVPALAHASAAGWSFLVVAALALTAAIALGMWTTVSCLLALTAQVILASAHGYGTPVRVALDLFQIVALLLIGPGAYSVDGIRFGRRVVVIPN